MSAPGLAWQACLKKTGVKLELLTDIDMLLMVEQGTRGGIGQVICKYAKANNKHMKNFDKDTESSHLKYLDVNNLCGWAMTKKLPVNGFEWVEDLSHFKEGFIKSYDEDSNKGCFLEVDVEYRKKSSRCLIFIVIYHFYLKEIKLKNVISLFVTFMTRKTSYQGFKTGTKSWNNTTKSAQIDSI